jgi:hypothetical protein
VEEEAILEDWKEETNHPVIPTKPRRSVPTFAILALLPVVAGGVFFGIRGAASTPDEPAPKPEPAVSVPPPPRGRVECKGAGAFLECTVSNPTSIEVRICWRVEASCSNTRTAAAAKCQEILAGKDETVRVGADDFGPPCDSIVTAKSADVSTMPVERATAVLTEADRHQPRLTGPKRCVLRAETHNRALLFPTEEGSDEFGDAEGRGLSPGELAVIAQSNHGFFVEDGTLCNFIEHNILSASKVRVLAGINAGRVGFTTDVGYE